VRLLIHKRGHKAGGPFNDLLYKPQPIEPPSLTTPSTMTRTERSLSPRAIIKDRSESKSGMDKGLRKGGAGSHNWGNINEEYRLEAGALDDEQQESVAKKGEHPATLRTRLAAHQRPPQRNPLISPSLPDAPAPPPRRTVLPLEKSANALLKTVSHSLPIVCQ